MNNLVKRTLRAVLSATLVVGWAQAQEFSVVVLPDTQNYVDINKPQANLPNFAAQTTWITNHIADGNERNIRFVTHVGDIVQRGNRETEWQRADDAMSVLDGVVPYSVLPGNHDWNVTNDKSSGVQNYLDTFGPQRFAFRRWFGGASRNGLNTYQIIDVDGFELLHIAIEWAPPGFGAGEGTSLAWAQSVLDRYPRTPAILSTHEYVDNDRARRDTEGEKIWSELIRRNNQIFHVLCGHFCSSPTASPQGLYHQTSTNDAGNPVHEVLQDFQCLPNGGDSYLRLVRINVPRGELFFETYAPALDAFQTDTVAQVGPFAATMTLPIDFTSRFPCTAADLDQNGRLEPADTAAFLALVVAEDSEADVNLDRDVDFRDVIEHLRVFDADCS